jgi:hypothetical protein
VVVLGFGESLSFHTEGRLSFPLRLRKDYVAEEFTFAIRLVVSSCQEPTQFEVVMERWY